jgi:sulfur carrier protein ThiS
VKDKSWLKWLVLGVGAVAIGVVAVGWAGTAVAQAASGPRTSTGSIAGHGGFGHWLVDMQALLAEALGIEVEELEAAQQAANEAAIQQLLDQGQLSEEQADLASAANVLKSYLDREAFVAEALGISVADLKAAVAEGQTLSDLLDEQGLDSATYRENLAAAEQAAIAQAVEDGVITQEQADQLQERGPGRFGFGPGRGGFHPGGFFGPGVPERAPEDTLNG